MHIKELLEWEDRIERGKSLLQEAAKLRVLLIDRLERVGYKEIYDHGKDEASSLEGTGLSELVFTWVDHVRETAVMGAVKDTKEQIMGAYLL